MNESFISTDVETDGPIPGPHSMLSLGSAAYTPQKQLLSTFSANFETLPGSVGTSEDGRVVGKPARCLGSLPRKPGIAQGAMVRYLTWVRSLSGRPVFVAYPAGFDFLFVYWYLMRFAGESPFSHSALDMKSYAMALLKTEYRESTKRNMPKQWFDDLPHTHVALDDAIEQGALFCNMLQSNLGK